MLTMFDDILMLMLKNYKNVMTKSRDTFMLIWKTFEIFKYSFLLIRGFKELEFTKCVCFKKREPDVSSIKMIFVEVNNHLII